MDNPQFDALAARLAARLNRRSSLGFLAAAGLPLAGMAEIAQAAKKAKKVTLCVKGQTVTVPKQKAKKLLKQGAVKGACPAVCPVGRKPCGNGCIPIGNCCVNRDCASGGICDNGSCISTTAPPRCGDDGFCSVFVSSTSFTGGELEGLAGADAECQSIADRAGISGTFKAWLSAGSQTPATRFSSGAGPWRLQPNDEDGSNLPPVVATNLADLLTCAATCLQHAIDRTQTGAIVSGFYAVWTATLADGTAATDTCAGWTSSGSGVFGLLGNATKSDTEWTNTGNTISCNQANALYCFEQAV